MGAMAVLAIETEGPTKLSGDAHGIGAWLFDHRDVAG